MVAACRSRSAYNLVNNHLPAGLIARLCWKSPTPRQRLTDALPDRGRDLGPNLFGHRLAGHHPVAGGHPAW